MVFKITSVSSVATLISLSHMSALCCINMQKCLLDASTAFTQKEGNYLPNAVREKQMQSLLQHPHPVCSGDRHLKVKLGHFLLMKEKVVGAIIYLTNQEN